MGKRFFAGILGAIVLFSVSSLAMACWKCCLCCGCCCGESQRLVANVQPSYGSLQPSTDALAAYFSDGPVTPRRLQSVLTDYFGVPVEHFLFIESHDHHQRTEQLVKVFQESGLIRFPVLMEKVIWNLRFTPLTDYQTSISVFNPYSDSIHQDLIQPPMVLEQAQVVWAEKYSHIMNTALINLQGGKEDYWSAPPNLFRLTSSAWPSLRGGEKGLLKSPYATIGTLIAEYVAPGIVQDHFSDMGPIRFYIEPWFKGASSYNNELAKGVDFLVGTVADYLFGERVFDNPGHFKEFHFYGEPAADIGARMQVVSHFLHQSNSIFDLDAEVPGARVASAFGIKKQIKIKGVTARDFIIRLISEYLHGRLDPEYMYFHEAILRGQMRGLGDTIVRYSKALTGPLASIVGLHHGLLRYDPLRLSNYGTKGDYQLLSRLTRELGLAVAIMGDKNHKAYQAYRQQNARRFLQVDYQVAPVSVRFGVNQGSVVEQIHIYYLRQ